MSGSNATSFQKIFKIPLDFSTLIFALILRAAKFLCKSVQSVVDFCKKLLKKCKKVSISTGKPAKHNADKFGCKAARIEIFWREIRYICRQVVRGSARMVFRTIQKETSNGSTTQ
jgi:hypothetical protein